MSEKYSWELDEHGGYRQKKVSRLSKFPLETVIISTIVCAVLIIFYSLLPHHHSAPMRPAFTRDNTPPANSAEFIGIGESVDASIVSIESQIPSMGGFFAPMMPSQSGSGVIISSDGYILTSLSLLSADEVEVRLSDGNTYNAVLKESDRLTDTAILKIDADSLTPLSFGDSDSLMSGQTIAVSARFLSSQLGSTTTFGTICGINKNVSLQNSQTINLIQTDASVAKNCGGAVLLNSAGSIIGMVTSMVSSGSDDIALAIPSNDIYSFVSSVISVDTPASETGNYSIGIRGADAEYGVFVDSVLKDSPAEKAGIKEGDLITKADGTIVKSLSEINALCASRNHGDKIVLTIYRDGEITDIEVVL